MLKLSLIVALTVAVASLPAVAKDKKPLDPDKRTCRSEVPTGSRFPVRICHTTAEWSAMDSGNESAARTSLDRATQSGLAASIAGGGASGR